MKLSGILAGTLLSVVAQSSVAASPSTETEERRGALGGALVGAAIAGPIGAGAGAVIGGGVFGKLWGIKRIESDKRTAMLERNRTLETQAQRLERYIAELNQDIDTLLANNSEWQKRKLPIQFKTASSEIEGHYEPQLLEVADLLARNPDTTIVLSGYADRRGEANFNQDLSEQRVAEVKAYLLSHGAERSQVITRAFGESQPIAAEGSPETHFFDRRVVMSFEVDMRSPLATR